MRHAEVMEKVDRSGLEPGMLVETNDYLILWEDPYWRTDIHTDPRRGITRYEKFQVLSVDHDIEDIYSKVIEPVRESWELISATRVMVLWKGIVGWVIICNNEGHVFTVLAR